jgi:hypothetical protein
MGCGHVIPSALSCESYCQCVPRLKLRFGNREFEAEGDPEFIEKHFAAFTALKDEPLRIEEPEQREAKSSKPRPASEMHAKGRTPAEFVRLKDPKTQMERLLVLAKYLEEERGMGEYPQAEVNKLAGEAKLKEIHGQFFTNATKQGYLRQPSRGKYALSLSGEDFIVSLPRTSASEE